MNIKDLQKIIDILQDTDVTDFELDQDGTTIKISRNKHQHVAVTMPAASEQLMTAPVQQQIQTPVLSAEPLAQAAAVAAEKTNNFFCVESPIVGTFYRKSSPDADSFVEVGTKVKKGDTLCIVEAMKLMNEIDSPIDGVVEEILIEDSQVVEFGENLFSIRPA